MRDSVAFVHVADVHLDAPFQGIAADDARVGGELADATYRAWVRVADLAIERAVDFVLVAGDAYNSADRSLRAQLAFREQAARLGEAGIPVLVVHGNHDPLGGWSAGLALPPSVHVFGGGAVERAEVVAEDGFVCAVYGRSFAKAAETEDFTPGFRRAGEDTVAIGLLHANVGSHADYDPYAPATVDGLRAAGMDYWALGHVHRFEVVSRDPWAVYAGSPQGLNPKETGEHGCCVVTVARGGAVGVEHVDLAPVAWGAATVDCADLVDIDDVERAVADACDLLRGDGGRPIVARLTLAGRSQAHGDLARPGALAALGDHLRGAQAALTPWVWIDRLEDATSAPIDLDTVRAGHDFAAEVLSVADELAGDPDAVAALVAEIAAPLGAKGVDSGTFSGDPDSLLAAARGRVLDALFAGDGGAR